VEADAQTWEAIKGGNLRTIATMISPEAEAYSRQATLDHHLAAVRHAEQAYRACVWNMLVHLASDHRGEKTEVIVARWGYQSVIGELEHDGLSYRVGGPEPEPMHRFTDAQVQSVTDANGFITIHIV